MSQRFIAQQVDINSELRQFIQLLQNEKNPSTKINELKDSKLSIILSASQQDSSSINNKQNSNSNNSNSYCYQKQQQMLLDLIEKLLTSGLTLVQNKLVDNILKKYQEIVQIIENKKINILEQQLIHQKKNNQQLIHNLFKINISEKDVQKKYHIISEQYENLSNKFKQIEQINIELNQNIIKYEQDKNFMQKLVLIANQNFESLQRKCIELQNRQNRLNKRKQKSSTDILNRSNKTKKKSYSPSQSDIINISPKQGQFQDIYRKMVIRTLKYKGKKNYNQNNNNYTPLKK